MSRQHQYLRYHSLYARSQVHGLIMPPSASRFKSLASPLHTCSPRCRQCTSSLPPVIARVIHDLRHDSPLQSDQSCGAGNTISIGRYSTCAYHPSFFLSSTYILPSIWRWVGTPSLLTLNDFEVLPFTGGNIPVPCLLIHVRYP